MAHYIRVDKAPETLKDNECVIAQPDFQEELDATRKRRGVSKLTTASNLRDIFMAITDKYDNTVNPYHLKLSKYEGREYNSDEELRQIIFKIMSDFDLSLLEKAVDFHIKNRPDNTDTIYYVSKDLLGSAAFIKNGINMKTKEKKVKVKE